MVLYLNGGQRTLFGRAARNERRQVARAANFTAPLSDAVPVGVEQVCEA